MRWITPAARTVRLPTAAIRHLIGGTRADRPEVPRTRARPDTAVERHRPRAPPDAARPAFPTP
ncbi:hypothetical protein [Streptomyces ziwulingensis]|uniref:Uncharacterized protein n=1 Tax=Streptomyces ziwulingensis TaxID=1045501 RepID=A0ABP9BRE4_9ACTN